MNTSNTISFNCLEIKQPIGVFYIGVMNFDDLIELSYADVRKLERREGDMEVYTGLQRPLSPTRIQEIKKYVNLVDATFPTGVILHANPEEVSYDSKKNRMTLAKKPDVLKILDGQHRIAGLENCKYPGNKFQINVTIFVGMDFEDQAIIFATINKSQTKVNKSLVADLFDFARFRSPQKTAHNIARALDEKRGSPFYEKIKVLGTANDPLKETITQATFVDSLLKYISRDLMIDRDIFKRGRVPDKATDSELKRLVFRNLFIDDEDAKIAQIVWNYFGAVSSRWPSAWKEVKVDMILNKSTGFVALMKFLKDVYLSFDAVGTVPSKEQFLKIFNSIDINENAFTKTNYLPGGVGQSTLYKELLERSRLNLQ